MTHKHLHGEKMRGKVTYIMLTALAAAVLISGFCHVLAQAGSKADGAGTGPAAAAEKGMSPDANEAKGPNAAPPAGHPGQAPQSKGGPGAKGGPGGGMGMMQAKQVVVLGKVNLTLPVLTKKYRGVIDPIERVRSIARVAGKITKIAFKEGDIVKKGDLLFEIEPDDYINNVESAKAAVESAEATIKEFEAKIRQVDAQIVYKTAVYRRYDDLYHNRDGAASLDDFENAASALECAKAEKAGAEASLKVAQAGLSSAKSTLALKQLDLDRTKIYSEITGKTGRLTYTLGNYVTSASEPLITVAQLDPIYVKFFLSEGDFHTLSKNIQDPTATQVRFMLADGNYFENTGQITFFDNEIDTSTDNIVIWARVANPRGTLNPGGIAKVYLDIKGKKELPSVPSSAVMRDNKGEFAWVVDSTGRTIKRRIVLGPETEGNVQCILSGLKAGETIVVDGGHKIMEGINVTDESIAVKEAQAAAAAQPGMPGSMPAPSAPAHDSPSAAPSSAPADAPANPSAPEVPAAEKDQPAAMPVQPGNPSAPAPAPIQQAAPSSAPADQTAPALSPLTPSAPKADENTSGNTSPSAKSHRSVNKLPLQKLKSDLEALNAVPQDDSGIKSEAIPAQKSVDVATTALQTPTADTLTSDQVPVLKPMSTSDQPRQLSKVESPSSESQSADQKMVR